MKELATVILAAGQGTRMKSSVVKVLHRVAGKPMLQYPLVAARQIDSQKIILVLGHQENAVREAFPDPDLVIVSQPEQLGTGHAVMCARQALTGFSGDILLLCGDVPLIQTKTLALLVETHQKKENAVTVLTTVKSNPTGYGRIIRDEHGAIRRIIEERDASAEEKRVSEINSGIYCFDGLFLLEALNLLAQQNAQNEYYLTDTVDIARAQKRTVEGIPVSNEYEVMGVNTRIELAQADRLKRIEILETLMLQGVTIIDPGATHIDNDVRIGQDTIVYPNTFIEGNSTIGSGCTIGAGCHIVNSTIGSNVLIKWCSVVHESIVRDKAAIGPFAHLRPGTEIGEEAKIGNFVEVKKSRIGKGSKASHLTYLGDSTIGSDVNVGAGTITCNYDGFAKHPTIIEDDVFIGSNTALVAPVQIGKGAIIGAGSTITKNVPSEALALERSKQINLDSIATILKGRKGKR
ncbi:MAG TPA: bifunctional UDP-N-acetylglucosamine diphosphorylase/glucosamine-1-phosphate N-acetyltransferase GlmU [Thermodesulfobacteriota bacterium]|nr:bifunctional UDP-N-acetylglucosamine diphosphorylase/glucosamine-1-phosphate N-acetyltransferase GlmU [Thermodesulfobacteriota bacterium]